MECASGYVVVCKRLCGGGLQHFSVSPSPLVTYWVLKLIGSWLGLGLGGFGTKGLGTGLDNFRKSALEPLKIKIFQAKTISLPYLSMNLGIYDQKVQIWRRGKKDKWTESLVVRF